MKKVYIPIALFISCSAFLAFVAQENSVPKAVQSVFDASCTDCHGPKRQRAGLDLSAAKAYQSLVDRASTEEKGMALVKPGDPANSYLWLKLNGSAKTGKGMPRGFFSWTKLPDKDLEAVRAWIAGGARP